MEKEQQIDNFLDIFSKVKETTSVIFKNKQQPKKIEDIYKILQKCKNNFDLLLKIFILYECSDIINKNNNKENLGYLEKIFEVFEIKLEYQIIKISQEDLIQNIIYYEIENIKSKIEDKELEKFIKNFIETKNSFEFYKGNLINIKNKKNSSNNNIINDFIDLERKEFIGKILKIKGNNEDIKKIKELLEKYENSEFSFLYFLYKYETPFAKLFKSEKDIDVKEVKKLLKNGNNVIKQDIDLLIKHTKKQLESINSLTYPIYCSYAMSHYPGRDLRNQEIKKFKKIIKLIIKYSSCDVLKILEITNIFSKQNTKDFEERLENINITQGHSYKYPYATSHYPSVKYLKEQEIKKLIKSISLNESLSKANEEMNTLTEVSTSINKHK